jgi:asparagine synthase (glutamine-hydrolysing)
MCGISVVVSRNLVKGSQIRKMTEIIQHRGPDGEGYILVCPDEKILTAGGNSTSEAVWKEKTPYQPIHHINQLEDMSFRMAMGHKRLAIVDLSAFGHLPMSYAQNRYWITFNGEIYNHVELRFELEAMGHTFYSQTDTEVILASYQEWGVECQQKFNGMWSFIIYDRETDEIFLSRDRFGIKPLYYWFAPEGNFCVASEIKQFTTLNGWEAHINPQRVYDYLVYSYTDHTDETMFHGVHQVPGGCYFKVSCKEIKPSFEGKVKWTRWYNLEEKVYQGDFDDASREFENLFKKAVNLQLIADVPIGSSLSGGIDSSAIVCQGANELKNKATKDLLKTFSSCATDLKYDEKKWMDIVINHVSVDFHFVYPRLEDVFKFTPKILWHQDEPYQSQSAFLGFHVFELAKQNDMKVILNGQGADEYLGGYNQFTSVKFNGLINRFKWKSVVNELKESRRYNQTEIRTIAKDFLISKLPNKLKRKLASKLGAYKQIRQLINSEALNSVEINPNESIPENLNSVKNISKHMLFHSTLPKYLRWEDRNSMANSIEVRVPYLDHKLVEFCYNLPEDYLEFNGETKRVQREGLKRILPKEIYTRKDKKGFITPEERWVKVDNPNLFREKLIEAIEISKGIINPVAITYYDKMILGEIPFDYTYWRLILFGEWINCFNIRLEDYQFEK